MDNEAMKTINENFRRIILMISSLESRMDEIASKHNSVAKEFSGIKTALLGANVLTKDGIDLHSSFDAPDTLSLPKWEKEKV